MNTLQPTNASEWQLYKVLQRANLLQYYDTFVAQGGDDVQQLCEAGEEEFLEIMALVGMASKPLHVRRLQKALQEWVANPAAFQGSGSIMTCVREPPTHVYSLPSSSVELPGSPWNGGSSVPSVPSVPNVPAPQKSVSPVSMVVSSRLGDYQQDVLQKPSTSPQPTAVLMEDRISAIAKCANKLASGLPVFEAKPLNMKKDINKQIYVVMGMNESDPDRLELCRKYGAIYGRFDSNRKKDKPMSMHEICVNEAAAQLCYHMPSLLTRREDLFPLARQVVKDSGYQYSKGHSRSWASELCPNNPSKRQKLEILSGEYNTDSGMSSSSLETSKQEREERLSEISRELSELSSRQEQIVGELDNAKEGQDNDQIESLQASLEHVTSRHLTLLTEQSDLLRKQSYEVYLDYENSSDREDSNLDASGSSSPNQSERCDTPHMALRAMLATGQLPKSAFTKAGMKNSLFDEGLRIAQQYGLGEFAEELKTLQGDDDEDDDDDAAGAGSESASTSEQSSSSHKTSGSKNSKDSKDKNSDGKTVKIVNAGENGLFHSVASTSQTSPVTNKGHNGVLPQSTSKEPNGV